MGFFPCFELDQLGCYFIWLVLINPTIFSFVCEAHWKLSLFDPFGLNLQKIGGMHWCPINDIPLSFYKLDQDHKLLIKSRYVLNACCFVCQQICISLKKYAKSSQVKFSSIVAV